MCKARLSEFFDNVVLALMDSAHDARVALIFVVCLIGAVALAIGPLFGIAWLVDAHSQWWFIAFLPYFLLLPLLLKPAGKLFEE